VLCIQFSAFVNVCQHFGRQDKKPISVFTTQLLFVKQFDFVIAKSKQKSFLFYLVFHRNSSEEKS